MACEATAYARAGLAGNPSDGYHGKTLSFIVRNFWAEVVLYPWEEVEIVLVGDPDPAVHLNHLGGDPL